jgi:aspartate aminotransferase
MPKPPIAQTVAADMKNASWIREMFEVGRRLKAQYGEDNVHDFSLGNPNASPPPAFFRALADVAAARDPVMHRYMPNAGLDEARAAVASFLAREYRLELGPADVILTCGAAGGMNVVISTICDPGDEVIALVPFFPEYRFYAQRAGARLVLVQTDRDFQPDLAAIEAALTPRTRAIIVNSPNNPTGAVYAEALCQALAELLRRHDAPDRPIYLVTDDPYRRLIYDLDWCPTPVRHYDRSIIVSSYSKDLSIPGERAGYIAVPHSVPERQVLLGGLTMLNRTLGFVNAPAFMQRVIARCAAELCDVQFYRANRDLLCNALREYGYDLQIPPGAFYAFPKTPIEDDAAFAELLVKQRILTVPGRGFGRAGHIRIAFCVERQTIERALPGFKRAVEEARQ